MNGGEWAIRLTAFLSFAGYVLALASCRLRKPLTKPSASGWWSLGLVAFLAHLVCAFHFEHGWSHAKALAATVKQTAERTRTESGVGIYLNYAFTLVWLAECVWWQLAKRSHEERPAWLGGIIHGFMAFMWFNATVVFGALLSQALGGIAFAGLGGWLLLQRKRRG